jgi:hypothetical protein
MVPSILMLAVAVLGCVTFRLLLTNGSAGAGFRGVRGGVAAVGATPVRRRGWVLGLLRADACLVVLVEVVIRGVDRLGLGNASCANAPGGDRWLISSSHSASSAACMLEYKAVRSRVWMSCSVSECSGVCIEYWHAHSRR